MLLSRAKSFMTACISCEYSRSTYTDEVGQIYRFNCLTFIKFLLSKEGISLTSNRACEMYDELDQSSNFQRVKSFSEIKPGDIIMWKKDIIPRSGDSGHVAIIHSVSLPFVRVIDCVKEAHFNDSRKLTGSAVGEGDIKIILDESKCVAKGFVWSDSRKKTKFTKIKFFRPLSVNLSN